MDPLTHLHLVPEDEDLPIVTVDGIPVGLVVPRGTRVVWNSGTVIPRMAYHYNKHAGRFEDCPRCSPKSGSASQTG